MYRTFSRSNGFLVLLTVFSVGAQTADEMVGRFDPSSPEPSEPWELVSFDKKIPPTVYRVIEWDGVAAVEAVAISSMALLARPLQIDLQQTPILCWRWRIDAPVASADMSRKSGDDYAARVYVSFQLPRSAINLATRIKLGLARSIYGDQVPDAAINYVWDNKHPVGTRKSNAYTDRTQMLVLRSGAEDAGHWVTERRDVYADFRQVFGDHEASPVQLAIASDTDNTGESARAGFAEIHFVARERGCSFSGSNG